MKNDCHTICQVCHNQNSSMSPQSGNLDTCFKHGLPGLPGLPGFLAHVTHILLRAFIYNYRNMHAKVMHCIFALNLANLANSLKIDIIEREMMVKICHFGVTRSARFATNFRHFAILEGYYANNSI